MKDKREKTFNSFDGLGDYMRQNGSNVYDEKSEENNNETNVAAESDVEDKIEKSDVVETKDSEVENTFYAFGADPSKNEGGSFPVQTVESKAEFNAMIAEDNLYKEIEQAQEILDRAEGMPSAENADGGIIEAEENIIEVSQTETLDAGVVSPLDREERLNDAGAIASEINHCDEVTEKAIEADPYLDVLNEAEIMRERLSQKVKDIIRETSPELFELINPRDAELMILIDETFKQHGINKGSLSEKIKLAKAKKITTNGVLADYSNALKRRDEFLNKAKELGVPTDVAKIIFKADPLFIKEIREGEAYALNSKNEDVGESVNEDEIVSDSVDTSFEGIVQNEPIPEGGRLESEISKETEEKVMSQKEEYAKKSEFFKKFIEKVIDESERERLLNGLNTFDHMIESITDEDSQDNIDRIYNTGDYMLGLEENIKSAINEKQLDIQEKEAAVEIASEIVKIEMSAEISPEYKALAYDEWITTLPSELVTTASMVFNPSRTQSFTDIKFYTDNDGVHFVAYTEQNGERQARKLYTSEDEFGVGGMTELVDPVQLEGNVIEEKSTTPEIAGEEETKEPIVKSKLENKLEVVGGAINKCRKIAHTGHDEAQKENALTLIRRLEGNITVISNDTVLTEETKIARINSLVKGAVDEVYEVYGVSQNEKMSDVSIEEEKNKSIAETVSIHEKTDLPKRETAAFVLAKYEKYGIGVDALKEIKGFFSDLTDGQKLLVLKNYESAILNKTKIESKNEADKEWWGQTKLGRIGLSAITLGMAQTFREKRKQQELANKIVRGDYLGFENRQAMLQSLVEIAKESPDVYLDKKGELEICYVNENKFRENPYAREILGEYNKAATEFAKIPFNWIDSANTFSKEDEKANSYYKKLSAVKGSSLEGKEKAKFSDVRDAYEKAKQNYYSLVIAEIGDSPENRRYVLKELNSLDERVRMNQMFNSDPNAEQVLQDIHNESVFNQTLSEFWSKKGKYMAYGALTRAVAAATVTSIAAPLGLIVVRQTSLLRSKRDVRDMMKLRRVSGVLTEQDLREDVVYNVNLEKSQADLRALLAKANEGGDTKAAYHMTARLNEVNDKLKAGNKFERRTRTLGEFRDAKFFSDRVEQLVSKYELLRSTKGQEAEAASVERKIAQTSTLMRELMNNGMLTFGKGENVRNDEGENVKDDSASMMNRLKFIQALALADTTISLDDEKIKEKMSRIVNDRREKLDKIEGDKAAKYITAQIKTSVKYGAVGYAIGHMFAEYFGSPRLEMVRNGMLKVEGGDNINEIITHNLKGLDHLSNNAKDNVISNFLNRLRPDQLKEIGISNPQSLKAGETINIEALQKYFDNTRVNGRTLVENARIITGEKPLMGQVSQLINSVYDSYQANRAGPDVEEISNANDSSNVANVASHKTGFVPADTTTPSHVEHAVDADVVSNPKVEVSHTDTEINLSDKDINDNWQDYTIPERIKIADKLIPEYLEKHLGNENMDVFTQNAKSMPSSVLRLTSFPSGGAKAEMLQELKSILEEKGITPDDGFEYNFNETLYDYVMKAYKLRIIQNGIYAVK